MSNQQHPKPRLTAEEVEVRIWGFVVIAVTLILCFIVVALLYSVTFVTQPIKSMAPIDQAYTKMLNDIVLLVVGGIGGVMSRKGVGALAEAIASPAPQNPCLQAQQAAPVMAAASGMPNFNWMGYKNPDLDESWTPGPPPTTPPDHQEPDSEREALALARKEVGYVRVPLPYAALGGLLLGLLAYFTGHHYSWAERDAEMQVEIARKNEQARATEQRLTSEIDDVSKTLTEANNALEQESSALQRAIRAGRLRLPSASCVQAPSNPPAAAGHRNDPSNGPDRQADQAADADRETLAAIAAIVAEGQRNTEQLNACIAAYNSVREQINAGNR